MNIIPPYPESGGRPARCPRTYEALIHIHAILRLNLMPHWLPHGPSTSWHQSPLLQLITPNPTPPEQVGNRSSRVTTCPASKIPMGATVGLGFVHCRQTWANPTPASNAALSTASNFFLVRRLPNKPKKGVSDARVALATITICTERRVSVCGVGCHASRESSEYSTNILPTVDAFASLVSPRVPASVSITSHQSHMLCQQASRFDPPPHPHQPGVRQSL